MRLLYILPFVPWRVRVRSFHLIPRLAQRHEISLLCLSGSPEEDARAEAIRPFCREIRIVRHSKRAAALQCARALPTPTPLRMAYFANSAMRRATQEAMERFAPEAIYVERWRTLQYVPSDKRIPVVCDPTDSMLLYNRRLVRTGSWWERVVGLEESLKFRNYEGQLARRAEAVVFCSRVDLDCVREHAPDASYTIVPNGVDCAGLYAKDAAEEEPDTMIFTGNFGYRPNRHAIRFFLEQVFPAIRREVPAARILAVGNGAQRHLAPYASSTPGLEIFDFVPEMRPYLARATVALAPITVGAGVSNKLLEAFATGTPVVSTSLACGDLPVRDGEHLLIGDTPERFAAGVVRLLRAPQLRREIAARARTLVEERYDWEMVAATLEQVLLQAVRDSSDAAPQFAASAV